MNVNDASYHSMASLLGQSFRSDHDPDAGEISGRSHTPSSTGATHAGSFHSINTVIGVEAPEHSPNAVALREKLNKLFEPHITEQNREAFKQLIDQRAIRLNEMGETPESVEATLAKGQKLDRVSRGAVGALNSVPFGAASRLLDTVPAILAPFAGPAMVGLAAGTIAGMANTVGVGMLKRATSDTQWLTAKPEELEPVMADAAKAREPSQLRSTLEASANLQTFTLRNILRTGLAGLTMTNVPDKKENETPAEAADRTAKAEHNANVKNTDSWISASGSVVAGGASALIQQGIDEHYHRNGPEYLLGRQDWEAQYTALKEVNPLRDPLINAGKRLAQLPVDIATDSLEATRKVFTASALMENVGMLGGGFAAVSVAQAAAKKTATDAGLGEPAVEAISQGVNAALGGPVFAAWAGASIMTGPAADKAANYLQEKASSLLGQAANYLHGRPSGSQPLPTDDTALRDLEEGRLAPQGAADNGQPIAATHNQNQLERVTEEPPTTVDTGQPSTSGQGEIEMVQTESSPPLNNAERNV
ncbi:hypothetical protein [Pseudomonas indica]|uniref:hypothetical protein n=1 Tax=Pseudomonas indica TaxID=137658 RepID=UPI000BD1562B|nr:hypothetical protein [Pseudomonas indica]PAU54751.1 hypothetical protein BZL42_20175 [Pseudomonas indica]